MNTWLLILSPALLFTAAQALVNHSLALAGIFDSGALTSCLLLPLVLLCFHKFRKASPHWQFCPRDGLLWLAVTAALAALNLCSPAQPGQVSALRLLSSVLCAPISEELIYRSFTLDLARKHLSPAAAALVSSFLFGAAHGSPAACAMAALLGLALCWMRFRFHSILFPILTHAVLNLTALLF